MASSKAGFQQKDDGTLVVVDQLASGDYIVGGAAENNLGGIDLDAAADGLPAIGDLTDIGTAEDESADWLLIHDTNVSTWKKVLTREFPQIPNYDALTESSLATGDHFHVWDTDVGYNKRITAEDLADYMRKPLFSLKASDQSLSSTSLTFITDLTQTVRSSTRYIFIACLLYQCTGGIKFDIDGGSATFNDIQLHFQQTYATGTSSKMDVMNNNYTNETTVVNNSQQNGTGMTLITGGIHIASGGSLGIRFARRLGFNSATIWQGSWLKLVPQI